MLPDSLDTAGLKLRLGKELEADDDLLGEYLESAFKQAQAPYPLGCGRLLLPDPPLDGKGEDKGEPVEREVEVRGRRVLVPDARELSKVEAAYFNRYTDEVEAAEEVSGYTVEKRDGVIVALRLPRRRPDWWWYGHHAHRRRAVVTLTGRFGFTAIPEDLREGIYQLAERNWYEHESRFVDQVVTEVGVQQYLRNLPRSTRLAFNTYAVPSGYAGLS